MATERKVTKSSSLQHLGAPPPSEPEHIPCPRCDSTNTKFCYYNNYNFSQPRHFCKSCRRYWTHGGTLRDIPVGGGSRKNAKRSRSVSSTTSSSSAITHHNSPVFMPDYRHHQVLMPFAEHGGSFTSLLTNQAAGLGGGLFGLGFGSGLVDELGRGVWGFQGGPGVGGWQVETAGDCFSLPELAISTPAGNLLK